MLSVILIAALFTGGDFTSRSLQADSAAPRHQFAGAVSIAAAPGGELFIAHRESHRVLRYTPEGVPAGDAGGYGWSATGFDEPLDVCAPNSIDIYIADYGNHRVQRLDRNLNVVSSLSLRDSENPREQFGYPRSVAVDRFGSLYIVDGENGRIVKIGKGNTFERAFGGIEAGTGRLRNPHRVRITGEDMVYVQDENTIVAFDLFGNYIRRVGEGLFSSLRLICVDGDVLYAVDSCSVVRITGKGTRTDRGFVNGNPAFPCDGFIDAIARGDSTWLLTPNAILRSATQELFVFPGDQQR
jgi:DNA-binding beta-propeller fold protein YncE